MSSQEEEEEDGVDIAAKKAKMILADDFEPDEEKGWVRRKTPPRPYPHLALRMALTRVLRTKDPRHALARATCVGPLHDPSLVAEVEQCFAASEFTSQLKYWDLKHPWQDKRNVPMMTYYVMVTNGLATGWIVYASETRLPYKHQLRPLLTEEEWDALICNYITLYLFMVEFLPAALWLYRDQAVDFVLQQPYGRHMLHDFPRWPNTCVCEMIPDDEETRTQLSLPRLRYAIQKFVQSKITVNVDCVWMGCLTKPPFGDTIFPIIDWDNLEPFEPSETRWHSSERLTIENERQKRCASKK